MSIRRLLVIVPCFNEEQALPGLVDRLEAASRDLTGRVRLQVLIVDDGSVDRTADIARARGLRLARLPHNLGIGGAVQTGLHMAARERFDFGVQIDGDGQHPPSELGKLIDAHDAAPADQRPDLIVGSRFLNRDGWKSTALRRLGIAWLAFVLRRVVGVPIADPTSGYRLYGPRALELFDRYYPYDFPEPESLAVAKAAGLRIMEVPVQMQERQGGASSIRGFKTAYYMLKVTLAVLLTFVRSLGHKARDLLKRR